MRIGSARLGALILIALATAVPLACGSCGDDAAEGAGDAASADGAAESGADGATGTDAAVDAGDAAPDARPPLAFTHADLNHVLACGGSTAIGSLGSPPVSLTQPYDNKMFSTGVMAGSEGLDTLVPLTEGDTIDNSEQPPVETMSSGFANLATKLAREDLLFGLTPPRNSHDIIVSLAGTSAVYSDLKKPYGHYAALMAQISAAKALMDKAGKSYVVRAFNVTHGESDFIAGNTEYAANLAEWQQDIESGAKAITGQKEPVPLFQTQADWIANTLVLQQLAAHTAYPGKVILVGPQYPAPRGSDNSHFTNEGYRHIGEYYAKAYKRVVLEGKTWEPLRPRAVTRAGNVLTVRFYVPVPPLVIDTTRITDPGSYGFQYRDDGASPPEIVSVALSGADSVAITFSAPPNPGARLVYGLAWIPPRGNIRDSDATPSRHGYPLFNWAVHFDEAVP